MLLLSMLVGCMAVHLVSSQNRVPYTRRKQTPDYLLFVAIFLKQSKFEAAG